MEILESIDTLKGHGPNDLNELVINLGSIMLSLEKDIPIEAIEYVENALESGIGYDKFVELVKYQHGDINDIKVAEKVKEIRRQ
ncbi:MAG: hypothetical protein V8R01_06135 [Bacilli bacterium]